MCLLHWVIRDVPTLDSISPAAATTERRPGPTRTPIVPPETRPEPRTSRRLLGGPSHIPALVLCAFLLVPLLGLLARAVGTGGVLGALGRPIVLEALRIELS